MIIDIRNYAKFKEDLLGKLGPKENNYRQWMNIDRILLDLYGYHCEPVTEDTIIGLIDMTEEDAVLFKLRWS